MSDDVVFGMRQNRARKLALTLIELGRAAEAEYIARDILKFSLEWSGRAHPETGRALSLLSGSSMNSGATDGTSSILHTRCSESPDHSREVRNCSRRGGDQRSHAADGHGAR